MKLHLDLKMIMSLQNHQRIKVQRVAYLLEPAISCPPTSPSGHPATDGLQAWNSIFKVLGRHWLLQNLPGQACLVHLPHHCPIRYPMSSRFSIVVLLCVVPRGSSTVTLHSLLISVAFRQSWGACLPNLQMPDLGEGAMSTFADKWQLSPRSGRLLLRIMLR